MASGQALSTKRDKGKFVEPRVLLSDSNAELKVLDVITTRKLTSFLDMIARLIPKGAKVTRCGKKGQLETSTSGTYVYPLAILVEFALLLPSVVCEGLKRIWTQPYILPLTAREF